MKRFLYQDSKQLKLLVTCITLIAFLANCSNKAILKKEEIATFTRVALGPGDEIEIKFFNVPELNEIQTVRHDGNISLHLVGDVHVEGMTVPELKDTLVTLFTDHLQAPEVLVIPRALFSGVVHVGGEVNAPGNIDMPGRFTALEAIMQAGGFNFSTASVSNVRILRLKSGNYYMAKLDLKAALKGKNIDPFYLEPHDIVFVPQTRITKVAQWLDRNLYSLLPPGFTYLLPYIIFRR